MNMQNSPSPMPVENYDAMPVARIYLEPNSAWKTVELNGEENEIPNGWGVQTYGQMAEFLNGDWGDAPSDSDPGVTCYRKADYSGNKINSGNTHRTSKRKPFVAFGDTIIEKSGGGTLQPVGAPALVLAKEDAICSNFMVRARAHAGINNFFFFHSYSSLYQSARIHTLFQQTTGIQNLNLNLLKATETAVPPLQEQTLIAQVLGAQETQVQELRNLAAVERQRLAWLSDELLSGRLRVELEPGDEAVEMPSDGLGEAVCLPGVRISENRGWKTMKANGVNLEIPIDWEKKTIGEVSTIGKQKTTSGDNYVGLENIQQGNGRHLISSGAKVVEGATSSRFERGNILYSKLRPYLRKAWIAEFSGSCSTEFIVLEPLIDAKIIHRHLLSDRVTAIADGESGGTRMPRTDAKTICSIVIPVPPSKEQALIAQVLSAQESQIADLERLADVEQKRLEWLSDELLSGRIRVRAEA